MNSESCFLNGQRRARRRASSALLSGLLVLLLRLSVSGQALPAHLAPLGKPPDWSQLDPFQETITHDDFVRLLTTLYAPNGAADKTIVVKPDAAVIEETADPAAWYILRFAGAAKTARPAPRYWRPAASFDAPKSKKRPLAGVRIALDPGHLGGKWAQMEARWFRIGATKPVAEGDMTLIVARLLASRLRTLGATVLLVRDAPGPLTSLRPADLREPALAGLRRQGVRFVREKYDGPADPLMQNSVQWESELLFYRNAEIRARARLVNRFFKPDLTLCLHFNAEAWGDPANPELTEKNHLHLLVNGCYTAAELDLDDVRCEMLRKLLGRSYQESLAVAESVAGTLARDTGLPPFEYKGDNAVRTGSSPYIWARNLLANRLYRCPVVYIEPYVMNSKAVFDRVQIGDYAGEREIGGVMRKSIYREYADAVSEGLKEYYTKARNP